MTRTGPSSGIGAHCPEAIGGCCRAFLLRAVVRRGGKLSYRSQFFSPPMKTVFAELSEDGYVKHNRPTKVIIGSPCARPRSACEPLDGRKARRLRSPGYRSERKRLFRILFGGKDSRLARVAGVLVGMDCHYLNNPCPASFPYRGFCLMAGQTVYALDESQLFDDFRAYMEEWSNNLGVSISELLTRIVLCAARGERYTKGEPNWVPFDDAETEDDSKR
jgi:hypothetical protein